MRDFSCESADKALCRSSPTGYGITKNPKEAEGICAEQWKNLFAASGKIKLSMSQRQRFQKADFHLKKSYSELPSKK